MGLFENPALIVLLLLIVLVVVYYKRRTSYTLDVTIEPENAATISTILYTKKRGSVVAEFTLDIKEGYALEKWTGTLPRLEGYDPARWYDSQKGTVRLEIDRNEKIALHFQPLDDERNPARTTAVVFDD